MTCASKCVFTTHTPVAGRARHASREDLVESVARSRAPPRSCRRPRAEKRHLQHDRTRDVLLPAAPTASRCATARSSRRMFPEYPIGAITNGVHAGTWTSPPFASSSTATSPTGGGTTATSATPSASRSRRSAGAHAEAKAALLDEVERRAASSLDPSRHDDRLRPPRHRLQARRPHLLRPRPPAPHRRARRPAPDRLRRQGAPARRRPARTLIQQVFAAAEELAGRRQGRLPRGLRHGARPSTHARASTSGSTTRRSRSRPRARAA